MTQDQSPAKAQGVSELTDRFIASVLPPLSEREITVVSLAIGYAITFASPVQQDSGWREPAEALRLAIHRFENETKAARGYMPAISTLLRIYADEMADKYPNDVNGGFPTSPDKGGA